MTVDHAVSIFKWWLFLEGVRTCSNGLSDALKEFDCFDPRRTVTFVGFMLQ
jgi:hypothetical protein